MLVAMKHLVECTTTTLKMLTRFYCANCVSVYCPGYSKNILGCSTENFYFILDPIQFVPSILTNGAHPIDTCGVAELHFGPSPFAKLGKDNRSTVFNTQRTEKTPSSVVVRCELMKSEEGFPPGGKPAKHKQRGKLICWLVFVVLGFFLFCSTGMPYHYV